MGSGRIRRAGGGLLRLRLGLALGVAGGAAWAQGLGPEVGAPAPPLAVDHVPEAPEVPEPMMLPFVLTEADPLAAPAPADAPVSPEVAESAEPSEEAGEEPPVVEEEPAEPPAVAEEAVEPPVEVEPDAPVIVEEEAEPPVVESEPVEPPVADEPVEPPVVAEEPPSEESAEREAGGREEPPEIPASGPVFVQVGAFADPANAEAAAALLGALGFAVGSRDFPWEGQMLRAIAAGPFATPQEGLAALEVIQEAGFAEAFVTK